MWSLRRSVVVFPKERELETSVLRGFSLTTYRWTSDFIGQICGRYGQPLRAVSWECYAGYLFNDHSQSFETQSICETLSTLKKINLLSKSTFYGHCLFKNVNGAIELLCMGTCVRCFRAIFALISKIVSSKAIIGNTHRAPPFETWISQHFDKELYSLQFNTAMLSCVQTDATLLTNNSQHCWMLHVASVCTPCCMLLDVVACCCAKFETGQTF